MAGAIACSRASDSASRSPRLPLAKAWTSSTTTRFSPAKSCALSGYDSSSDNDSGVVSRTCGGRARCRALRSDGVSPLRVSTRIARPISAIGAIRLRCTSCASAFSGET